ncbi:unnamed protein product [Oreochromis niloticus]|nr:unnamed protein product [Mustela putorius furo]
MTSGAEAPVAVQSPTFDPISQVAAGLVTEDLKLALRLKEVELEAKAKEVELMHLRIRAMELDPSRARDATPVPVSTLPDTSTVDQFNASKQIVLVPPFREGEVDSYFTAFERIATTLKWPKDVWSLLLQCKLVGRAQEVCASLSIADSLDYEVVKATILRAYELVPEAYRQKFRACSKSDRQTFVEFAREKAVLFDKWLAASKVKNFTELKELILLEEFKTCLPESIVVYLNEQKMELLSKAAVLADEFVLTHRASLSTSRRECVSPTQHAKSYRVSPKRQTRSAAIPVSDRKCFYCHEIGHLVAACPSLQRKEQAHTVRKPKSVGFVRSTSASTSPDNEVRSDSLDDSYRPFVSEGFVSLNGKEEDRVPITILRDTGAAQTLILRGILPFSDFSFCGSDALVWGVKMDVLRVPLHKVFLQSPLVSGPVTVGVRDYLPVPGVAMILGNDLANGKVFFTPRVVENPVPDTLISDPAAERSHSVFPACAVTRAHKRRYGDVDLSDSFLCAGGEPESESKTCDPLMGDSEAMLSVSPSVTSQLPSGVNKKDFVLAQHSDPTLVGCFSAAHSSDQYPRVYSVEDDVLIRTWYPPAAVPKADKTPRFCTDFRKVNSVTKPDSYPLPRMEDCVDRVGSAKFVTKLDLLKGYWQVPLTSRAAEISAFVTPDHFLQYTVMPFGLRNTPATFQRLMNIVLGSVRKCEVYLDDIVVYSDTWSEHIETLTDVFHRLGRASLTLNLAKCDFGKAMVTYLGKQVGQGQVRPLLAKIQAILDFPAPRTRRELRRFLGMVGYYRGFCRNLAEVVAPLTGLTSVLKPFVWSSVCQSAFLAVKALLCSAPVLAAPDFARPFKLEVDASANGAGAVLLQEDQHGVDHPIGYFSKKFNVHQRRYSTIEKEALSLLFALQHFEVYVGSSPSPVIVYTDHNPLVFLMRMQNSNQRLMRWSLLVQDFNLDIRHKKGTENVLADALSRTFL